MGRRFRSFSTILSAAWNRTWRRLLVSTTSNSLRGFSMPASSDNAKWTEKRPLEDFYRILNPDGSLRGDRPAVDNAELLTWYRTMLRMRMFEDLNVRMQRRGELSV